jgi:hypothetical protein
MSLRAPQVLSQVLPRRSLCSSPPSQLEAVVLVITLALVNLVLLAGRQIKLLAARSPHGFGDPLHHLTQAVQIEVVLLLQRFGIPRISIRE